MQDKLKERLFGAIVLIALGVIFIPMLFNEPIPAVVDPAEQLPAPPDWSADAVDIYPPEDWIAQEEEFSQMATVVFDLPSGPSVQLPAVPDKVLKAKKQKQSTEAKADEEGRKVLEQLFSTDAWAVQLATFSDTENAQNLVSRLNDSGFPAYLEQTKGKNQLWSKVMVGPELDRTSATALLQQLQDKFSLEGLVVPYDPVSG